jgi:hypothetical protein
MFQRLEVGLREAGSVTPTVHVNGSRLHQPMNVPQLQLRNENYKKTHAISHEKWDNPKRVSSTYFKTISCSHISSRGTHICFQTIILYACNYSNHYNKNTMRMKSFYTTFNEETKHVLRVRMCSPSTTLTSYICSALAKRDISRKGGLDVEGRFHGLFVRRI